MCVASLIHSINEVVEAQANGNLVTKLMSDFLILSVVFPAALQAELLSLVSSALPGQQVLSLKPVMSMSGTDQSFAVFPA